MRSTGTRRESGMRAGRWLSLLLVAALTTACSGFSLDRATGSSDRRSATGGELPDDAGGSAQVDDRRAAARDTLERLIRTAGYDPGDIEVDQPLEPSGGEQAAVHAVTTVDHDGDPVRISWHESPPDRSRQHGPRSEIEVGGVAVTIEEPVDSTGWSPSAWFDCGGAEVAVTHRPDGPDGEVRVITEVVTALVGAEDCRATPRRHDATR